MRFLSSVALLILSTASSVVLAANPLAFAYFRNTTTDYGTVTFLITFTVTPPGFPTIEVTVNGLKNASYNYHVHESPVSTTCTSTNNHLWSFGNSSICGTGKVDCGDLSGLYGKLVIGSDGKFSTSYVANWTYIDNVNGVTPIGYSVVIHAPGAATRIACGNIFPYSQFSSIKALVDSGFGTPIPTTTPIVATSTSSGPAASPTGNSSSSADQAKSTSESVLFSGFIAYLLTLLA